MHRGTVTRRHARGSRLSYVGAALGRAIGALVAGAVALALGLTYTIGGGYFPGGPMHFPGDDIAPAQAVSGAFMLVCAIAGALWWLWEDWLSLHVSKPWSERISGALGTAGFCLLFACPVLALVGLVVYLSTGAG